MKIDLETVHLKIEDLRGELKNQMHIPCDNSFESGRAWGGLFALSDLKITLLQWELQERTKGNQ